MQEFERTKFACVDEGAGSPQLRERMSRIAIVARAISLEALPRPNSVKDCPRKFRAAASSPVAQLRERGHPACS